MISLSQMINAMVFNNGIYSHEQRIKIGKDFQNIYGWQEMDDKGYLYVSGGVKMS